MIDFAGYDDTSGEGRGTDFGIRNMNGLWFDIKDNYSAAGVPMLPVVRGDRATARQIVLYSAALVGVTLLPWAVGRSGLPYLASALALGAVFVWLWPAA